MSAGGNYLHWMVRMHGPDSIVTRGDQEVHFRGDGNTPEEALAELRRRFDAFYGTASAYDEALASLAPLSPQ